MICSVKFLHPMTMRWRCSHAVRQISATAMAVRKIDRAKPGRARVPPVLNPRVGRLTARLDVEPLPILSFADCGSLAIESEFATAKARSSPLWREPLSQPAKQNICCQCHQRSRNRAGKNHSVVDHRQAAKDELT